jgi:hypothetical protein
MRTVVILEGFQRLKDLAASDVGRRSPPDPSLRSG